MADKPIPPNSDASRFITMISGKAMYQLASPTELSGFWAKLWEGAAFGVTLRNTKGVVQVGRAGTFLFDTTGTYLGVCFYDS